MTEEIQNALSKVGDESLGTFLRREATNKPIDLGFVCSNESAALVSDGNLTLVRGDQEGAEQEDEKHNLLVFMFQLSHLDPEYKHLSFICRVAGLSF